jgi:DNA-binding CsgD family transcriptional regulator
VTTVEIVGRDEELRSIEAFLERTSEGPAALVLEGAAGIGKSTLWLAAVETARERGLQILSAQPAEAERGLAHAGLGDLFEGVLDRVRPALPPPRRRALEVALLVEEAGDGSDPRTLAVAVRSALEVVAADGPVVLAVDDVQWLDSSSADALAFALRRLRKDPVLLLLARRLDDGAEPSDLERAIEAERAERLRVGPLSVGAIQALLRARLDRVFSRPTLIKIHDASGGNPFYALELARALGGDIDPTQPLPVPETLEALLRKRLDGLPEPTREALVLVSAAGSLSDALLQAAGVAREALEPALESNVIEHDAGVVRFTHPLLTSVLYQGPTAGERRGAHRHIAELVDDPVARARHLALASDGADAEIAGVLEEATAAARMRGALTVAAELGELARRLTPPDDHEGSRRRALVAARTHVTSGDLGRAQALAHELLARTSDGHARAEALVVLSDIRSQSGALEDAIALRRQALLEARGHPPLLAAIHASLGAAVRITEGLRAAERHALASLEIAERLDDAALHAKALASLALLRFNAGEAGAFRLAEQAHELAATAGDAQYRLQAAFSFAHVLVWSVQHERGRALLESLHRELRERDELWSAEALWYLSLLELQAGRWALAADYIDRYRKVHLQYATDGREDAGTLVVAARVAVHRGELAVARELAERGRTLAERQSAYLAPLEAVLGFADFWSGDGAAAAAHFAAAERAARAAEFGEPNLFSWRAEFAEALLELGQLDDAVRLLDNWERGARRVGREWVLAQVRRCRGLVAAARGDVDLALSTFEQAVVQHEKVEDPFGRARALLALGVTRRRARQKRAAREAIEASLAAFEELGAATWTEKARAELGRIGGRTRAHGLSPAERRVAELVAEGRTNREVAAALVLGERTVETHLTHVYAKLGVRSRTELARTLRKGS